VSRAHIVIMIEDIEDEDAIKIKQAIEELIKDVPKVDVSLSLTAMPAYRTER